jgi:hypothetical protein
MPEKSTQEQNREIKQKKRNAYRELMKLAQSGIKIVRPVFIVPGWTDESCENWVKPYALQLPLKAWTNKIVKNKEDAYYITFKDAESKSCKSFIDFGDILKDRIENAIGKSTEFDIVGHSMGGLDIRSAISIHGLRNAQNCITVATPHKGAMLGEIEHIFKIRKYPPHHMAQCNSLARRSNEINTLNSLVNRKKFLEAIRKLFQFSGTYDKVVQIKESRMECRDLNQTLQNKAMQVLIDKADHVAERGITRDVRVVLAVLSILIGIEPLRPKYNYGYLYKKA